MAPHTPKDEGQQEPAPVSRGGTYHLQVSRRVGVVWLPHHSTVSGFHALTDNIRRL